MLEAQFRGDLADVPVLVGRDERDADTFGAGAARVAGPVDVSVTVGRRVEVDHVGDSVKSQEVVYRHENGCRAGGCGVRGGG